MIVSLLIAALGVLIATVCSLVPALHIYSVAGLLLLALPPAVGDALSGEQMCMLFVGMVTGYGMLAAIPSTFLAAPDESTIFMMSPARGYLLQRRGHEAVALSGIGGLGGVVVLALLTPVAPGLLSALRAILQPHLHWILWSIIAYVLLSEWPKGAGRASTGWRRWWDGWKSLVAGLVTFFLSGILGFIVLYRSLVPVALAHHNLLPAFAGLFAVPWMVETMISRTRLPRQHVVRSLDVTPGLIVRGTLAGALGGLFAAFFPVVTGGIGGLLAGQATAQRDDRLFLISQGAARVITYSGALLLLFVPQVHLTRGGLAWMVSARWSPSAPGFYYVALAGVVFSGLLSFFFLLLVARVASRLVGGLNYRLISAAALGLLLVVVTGTTGWGGLAVCVVAAGIGLIPVLWGSRRMNAMGVLLVPLGLSMAGWGPPLASWLGLV